jgi:hypothetical protein
MAHVCGPCPTYHAVRPIPGQSREYGLFRITKRPLTSSRQGVHTAYHFGDLPNGGPGVTFPSIDVTNTAKVPASELLYMADLSNNFDGVDEESIAQRPAFNQGRTNLVTLHCFFPPSLASTPRRFQSSFCHALLYSTNTKL